MNENWLTLVKSAARTVRSALWFRPAAACLAAVSAAVLIAAADVRLPAWAAAWLPQVNVKMLEELLRLAAGSMLTVATVTLSVLMLVLSIAAGQASPRTVPELMADPVTQNALSTFLATFVFALSSLLLFGSGAVEESGVTLVFLVTLVLVALAVKYLVQWIHHVADTLKLNSMIQRVHRQTQRVLDSYLDRPRDAAGEGDGESDGDGGDSHPWIDVRCDTTGYVRLVDEETLADLAKSHDVHLRLCVTEGDFVHPPLPLMQVTGTDGRDDAALAALRDAVVLGADRSAEGDPLLGFELLAEIGSRALSPGINDPQSALTCIGYLTGLLARVAAIPPGALPGPLPGGGRVRVIRPGFDAMIQRAYRPLARDGAAFAEVACAIQDALHDLACCADPGHLNTIAREGERALHFALERLVLEQDRETLRRAARRLDEVIARRSRDGVHRPQGAAAAGG